MSNKLQKRNVPAQGSVFDVAKKNDLKVEEVIMDAEAIVMVDVSGSMATRTERGQGPKRWDLAKSAMEQVQRNFSGKVLLFSFNHSNQVHYDGNLPGPSGGTQIAPLLRRVKEFDGTGMKFILISDGLPGDQWEAEEVARSFTDPIDTIFIGDPGEHGEAFMNGLATGQALGRVEVKKLGAKVAGLLISRS